MSVTFTNKPFNCIEKLFILYEYESDKNSLVMLQFADKKMLLIVHKGAAKSISLNTTGGFIGLACWLGLKT